MAKQSAAQKHKQASSEKGKLVCGDVGVYSKMQVRPTNKQQRDHVPATNSMLAAAEKNGYHKKLTGDQIVCFERFVKSDALTIAIPKQVHRKRSRTCSNKGGQKRVNEDIADLKEAAKKDFEKVKPGLSDDCKKKYEEAEKKVLAQLPDKLFEECKQKALDKC